MKKEAFMKLGLNEEAAKKCETASMDELRGYIPKARFDQVNNEKKKLEALKNSVDDVEQLKEQIESLLASLSLTLYSLHLIMTSQRKKVKASNRRACKKGKKEIV